MLCGVECSPNIFNVINYRRLRWAEHIARKEESKSAFKILRGKQTYSSLTKCILCALSSKQAFIFKNNLKLCFQNYCLQIFARISGIVR